MLIQMAYHTGCTPGTGIFDSVPQYDSEHQNHKSSKNYNAERSFSFTSFCQMFQICFVKSRKSVWKVIILF